ncbi:GAF domain-containing protein [Roseobacter sp. HKCCD9010]|uniref:GAF domain-containing protein n=1 Tax=unclassified Roseobacter TaxID=196798 RepID=UPI001491A69E|nr:MULTISPECIES: GAF domain-containing protein [unclassified Roseobacter]MBF9051254.1 GAF domain-containing protein [Rhodobacterales bacterium HKCCD4356]NNV13301.1 GAF domain-containing protein [Roseobacter sp. HKCCD7357]NNV17552.1 GAF domain-containing protein [Roseobacter sp. HKCCD8768]NNV27158.1 GAF domain-containing protein [Roseobacter sp. HKCCD8192]NNV31278.1 GAF domain-containing protein [Roseobacter sp. HKCCD9061]
MLDDIHALRRFGKTLSCDKWISPFPALEELCQVMMGHKLFSCSIFRMSGPQQGVAARVYSNDAGSYPISGLKEIVPNRWTEHVILRRQTFVANSVDGFMDVFPDHALIASLGLGSVVNLPVILRGEFIGTVNMLHTAGHYTDARLRAMEDLVVPSLLAFEASPEAAK